MKKINYIMLICFLFLSTTQVNASNGGGYSQSSSWDELAKALAMILFIALIIAGSYVFYLVNQMNNVKKQSGAKDYMEENSFHLFEKSDQFLYSNTTKVRIQKNNNGPSKRK